MSSSCPDTWLDPMCSRCYDHVGPTGAMLTAALQVRFVDRTVLNLDSSRQHCKLLLPDGTVAQVAVSSPAGLQQYVQPTAEFATWAFKSAAQRAAELRSSALVQVGGVWFPGVSEMVLCLQWRHWVLCVAKCRSLVDGGVVGCCSVH